MAATIAPCSSHLAMAMNHNRDSHCSGVWRDQIRLTPKHSRTKTTTTTVSCSAVLGTRRPGRNSEEEHGLRLILDRMKDTFHDTDNATYARILRLCTKFKALQEGKRVHAYIRESGRELDRILGNHLVEMYLKCGTLRDAQRMFDEMTSRDAVLWTSMISAYSERGFYKPALKLFQRMLAAEDVSPDNVTYITILSCCGRMGALEEGKFVHSQLRGSGFEDDVIVKTTLLNMYGKCGSLQEAREVFDSIQEKDIVVWNAMFSGYVLHRGFSEALELYREMELASDVSTFVTLLNACAGVGAGALGDGRRFHECIREQELEYDGAISNALFHMYGKCGSLDDAFEIFLRRREKDRVVWTHMISYYIQHHRKREGLRLLRLMQLEGVRVDKFTFTTSLSACNGAEDLPQGILLHDWIEESGFDADVVVRSSLIHMYGRCGSFEDAWDVFSQLPTKNILLSGAMIAACERHGKWQEILDIFRQVQGVPYKLTTLSVLKACSELRAYEDGKSVHEQIKGKDLYLDAGVREGLVMMYCRCGRLEEARLVFDGSSEKSLWMWNSMIEAFVREGQAKLALEMFEQMQVENVEPDKATVSSILAVDEGYRLLSSVCRESPRLSSLCREAGVVIDEQEGDEPETL